MSQALLTVPQLPARLVYAGCITNDSKPRYRKSRPTASRLEDEYVLWGVQWSDLERGDPIPADNVPASRRAESNGALGLRDEVGQPDLRLDAEWEPREPNPWRSALATRPPRDPLELRVSVPSRLPSREDDRSAVYHPSWRCADLPNRNGDWSRAAWVDRASAEIQDLNGH